MSTENRGSDTTKRHLHRVIRISAGIVFLILGVIGSLLPILQGWIFFLLALITFFPDHPKVAEILEKAEPKFPRLVRFLRKLGIGRPDETTEQDRPETEEPGASGLQ